MNSSRNKKLLACFLTALGLSANSLNVSAKNSQFMSNMKFELNKLTNSKFFGGTKIEEKAGLDILLEESEKLYNSYDEDNMANNNVKKFNFNNDEEAYNKFFELCSRLYNKSTEIINHRISKRYNSLLRTSLGQILNDYPLKENNNNEVNYENMKAWLLKIVGSKKEDSGIKWGKFSVGSIIKEIAYNLFSANIAILAENLEAEKEKEKKENSNNLLIKVKDKNEEVKPESKEEKINRIIKNNFKITISNTVLNFELSNNKFNEFKEQVEDIDNNGIIKMNENSQLSIFKYLSIEDVSSLKVYNVNSPGIEFGGGRYLGTLTDKLNEINNKTEFDVNGEESVITIKI